MSRRRQRFIISNSDVEVDMESRFNSLDSDFDDKDSVLSFLSYRSIFKVEEIMTAIKEALNNSGLSAFKNALSSRGGVPGNWKEWFIQGVDCDILKPGKNWQKGKLRIKVTLEFCPDEPEVEEILESNQLFTSNPQSPLDDIRKMVNENC